MQEYHVTVYDNRTDWCQNGKHHRIDGPAIERIGIKTANTIELMDLQLNTLMVLKHGIKTANTIELMDLL